MWSTVKQMEARGEGGREAERNSYEGVVKIHLLPCVHHYASFQYLSSSESKGPIPLSSTSCAPTRKELSLSERSEKVRYFPVLKSFFSC